MTDNYLPGLCRHNQPANAPLLTLECADHIPADSQAGRERHAHGHFACKRPEVCICPCHRPGVHMYAVQVQCEVTRPDGYTVSRGLPTFYLHPDVQGIVSSQHAEKIVRDILPKIENATGGTGRYHVSVVLVTIEPHY